MKYTFTILLFLQFMCVNYLHAQSEPSIHFSFNHLALSVKNVDRSAEFYTRVLHLSEITNRTKKPGIRWFSLGDGKELHLISTIPGPVQINKAVHFAFTTPDFEALVQLLIKEKIGYSDWPGVANQITTRADGIRQLYFQDPDGYWIEVNSVE